MRKVDVVRPPINYAVIQTSGYAAGHQIAWFLTEEDANDFVASQVETGVGYEIAEARR